MVSDGLREQLAGTANAIPEAEVPEHLGDVWRCWGRLSEDREWTSSGMGGAVPRKIGFQQVVNWCRFHEVPGADVPFFDMCVREMDKVYIAWAQKKPTAG